MTLRQRFGIDDFPSGDERGDVLFYKEQLMREVADVGALARQSPARQRATLEKGMDQLLSRSGPVLSTRERTDLVRRVVDEILGFGPLQPLLDDPGVTEIMVNAPDSVYVERDGRLVREPTGFRDETHLRQTIERIVAGVNRRVDESSPMVDARLPTGERVNIVVPPLALSGPALTIRRFPRRFDIGELVAMGSLDAPMADLLAALVRARCSVLVSGGTGSGKTTLLNALSSFIPESERIITIEDAAELRLDQRHLIRLEARPANVEGKGQVTIRDLVRNSLRMRPDRIIVGEVRGGETLDMLQAMSTGHEGSLTTVHANSARDALERLQTLASMSELNIPFGALHDQINSAVDVIVHLERSAEGRREIAEIAALTSRGGEPYELWPVTGIGRDPTDNGAAVARFRHQALPPGLARRLQLAGEIDAAGGLLRPAVSLEPARMDAS
jgi:pilus assembly protein CpaF